MDQNQRNLFLTIALSILILIGWQVFYMQPRIEAERQRLQAQAELQQAATPDAAGVPGAAVPGALPGASAPTGEQAREAALAQGRRIPIETGKLTGSINLAGARLDDLRLKDYRETIAPGSPIIELLNPSTTQGGYFAEFGYAGFEGAPGPDAAWQAAEGARLTPQTPVVLTYTAPSGVSFERTVAIDDKYMFTVTDRVTNTGAAPVSLSGYGRVMRFSKPAVPPIWVLHEGMIGVHGEEGLTEIDYSEIEDDKRLKPGLSTDGWLGITDKYWATALVPKAGVSFQPQYDYFEDGRPRYQAGYSTEAMTVAPGATREVSALLFAGAKVTSIIDGYEASADIRQFELMIDWGWFHFITKPLYYLIDWLFQLSGNFGVAILLTTVVVKAVFYPLANMSYKSMAKMKVLQPAMQRIKEEHPDDRQKQQQAMMELYKREQINPVAGCWPILVQIPVFFALYKVIYVTIEMRHAPFFGWIQDLSAPDPTSIFNLFGLLPFAVPAILLVGVWPIIMGITMFLQMRMNPTPPDPTQAMIFTWMPVMFTFMLASFPAGLVIYWAWNNLLSIIQQGVIMKRQGAKIELWDNLVALFRRKPKPAE